MLGALFATFSAASFGLTNAAVRRGVLGGSVAQGVYISVLLGMPLALVAAAASGQLFEVSTFPLRGHLALAAAGVGHFLFARYCAFRAIKAIGANRVGPVHQTALLVGVVLAVGLLGERVTPMMALGMALILVSPVITARGWGGGGRRASAGAGNAPSSTPEGWGGAVFTASWGMTGGAASGVSSVAVARSGGSAKLFTPRLAEGYLFGLLSAVGYGVTDVLVRWALSDTGLGLMGGLVSYAAASAVLLVMLPLPGQWGTLRAMDGHVLRWFGLSAFAVFGAQMFRYVALGMAPVTIVVPLIYTNLIFRVVFSFLINRRTESFEPRVLIGIALAVLGGAALVL